MRNPGIRFYLMNGFEDPALLPEEWNALLALGSTDVVFLTWQWQKAWWEAFGRGKLLLIIAKQEEKNIAIASMFADEGMIFFTGSGGSDYLDFIGNIQDPNILEGMLALAMKCVPGFVGFRFYHVPEYSSSNGILEYVANLNGWDFYHEGELFSPVMGFAEDPAAANAAPNKKSLLRHEGWFKRNGILTIEHLTRASGILPQLNSFFEQHIKRWEQTPYPSLFLDLKKRFFYQRLVEIASASGWLRFTRVVWNDHSIAYHFGFNYKGSFFWYKPSLDISLSNYSPGEVLLRQLLLKSINENAHTFDFGLGEESFKERFATSKIKVNTWGVYLAPGTNKGK